MIIQIFERNILLFYVNVDSNMFSLSSFPNITFCQIKAGDTRVLASTSFLLVKRDWSPEIRLHAFKMLQVYLMVFHFQFASLVCKI